jgi:8-oxo-dGTP pyrophosphatase MutT (NUDIX family)
MRRHWAFGVVLAAGLALRVAALVAYQPALVYLDSARYLGADQRGLDPLGYSYLLLRPVLLADGGLAGAGIAGVAAVQHALGLAMAVCLYLLAMRLGAARWLAVLAAAPVLLDAYQVQAEQMIMPDVLFEALIVAAVTVLLWRPDPGLARLAGAAALLGVSATVRQVGEVLALPLLGYALAPLGSHGERGEASPRSKHWKQRGTRAAAALAVFALPVVGYMALSATVLGNGFRLSNMDDAYLYGRMAHAADCATLRLPAYERPLCPSPNTAAGLGVDGLATDPHSAVFTYRPPAGVTRGAATARFDEAVLTQQPLRVAGDVAKDAIKVFALTRDTARGDPPVSRWQFPVAYPVYSAADDTMLDAARPRVVAPLADALRAYQLHGGFTPGPLLLAFLFFGTMGGFFLRRHRTAALACVLVTGLAAAALLGADLYEFSWRYQLPALVTLPLAGTVGFAGFTRGGSGGSSPPEPAGHNEPVHTDPENLDALAEPEIRTLSSSVVYTDNWIRLRRDDIERRDGSRGTYAFVERRDFALVIPAENGGFHLVEEYRYPVGRRSWSFPQGGFPHGVTGTADELARMELAQETGLRARRLTHLGSLTAGHGLTSQYGDYFVATDLEQGPPDPEPEELGIRQAWVTRDEFETMVCDTRITDDSTLAGYALLLLAERRGDVVIR